MGFSSTELTSFSEEYDWQWQKYNDLPYLTCYLLKDWQHGFFTSLFYPQSPEELTKIFNPHVTCYRLKQVHGNSVLTPSEIKANLTESGFAEADGIISDDISQAVWVASADCTPVLIGDVKTRKVAAIHAGWRGTAKKIVPNGIQRFLDSGSQIQDLRVAMGPAITGQMYQVDQEVAVEVGKSLVSEKIKSPKAILETLYNFFDSPLIPDMEEGKIRLDVPSVNYLQLKQLGFSDEQISIAPYCTYQQANLFFSYRRTHEKQVQWSGIAVTSYQLPVTS